MAKEPKKTITDSEHLQLVGLLTLGIHHRKLVDLCIEGIEQRLGLERGNDYVSDMIMIYGGRGLEWTLEALGITVEAADAPR